ncbi:MAG: UDP-N-acetylglucosamine 2-epimerase, partial [Candidatus Gastranaerophilaceae bacterium]
KIYTRLAKYKNIKLLRPLDYPYLVYLMKNAKLILTDSGGIQEEAPSFGCPTLVMRYETERQEGIDAGVSILVGADYEKIVSHSEKILSKSLDETRLTALNPYGDGTSSKKIESIIEQYYSNK